MIGSPLPFTRGYLEGGGQFENIFKWTGRDPLVDSLHASDPEEEEEDQFAGKGMVHDSNYCVRGDPEFENAAQGNFRLDNDSVFTGEGNPGYLDDRFLTDLDSKPRVANGKVDIGAYQSTDE